VIVDAGDGFRWTAEDVPLLIDDAAQSFGVRIAFSKRDGGVSERPFESLNLSSMVGDDEDAVRANRARFAAAAGFEPEQLVLTKQIHGAGVLQVGAIRSWQTLEPGDALVTSEKNVAVGVLTADCVPVLLAGHDRVAAVHAGWRGLVAGVIEAAVAEVGDIRAAWVGPSIHACCYEVGPEVIEAFRDAELPVGDTSVDPGRAASMILHRAGVERVTASSDCTSCDERFFSYRRDGATGRQGAFISCP
jgi:YfiH family protein